MKYLIIPFLFLVLGVGCQQDTNQTANQHYPVVESIRNTIRDRKQINWGWKDESPLYGDYSVFVSATSTPEEIKAAVLNDARERTEWSQKLRDEKLEEERVKDQVNEMLTK
jgi:hypothetical protein